MLHEILLVVAQMEKQGVHTQDGQRTMGAWLRLHLGLGFGTARRWDQMSSKAEELPRLAGAFAEGRLSFDKLVEGAAIATPDNEEEVTKEAVEGSIGRLELQAHAARLASRDKEERIRTKKYVRFFWRDDGTRLEVNASLAADEGAKVRAALERMADSYPLKDEEGDFTTKESRCADALVELSQAKIADDHDPDRATVVVGVDLDTLLSGDGVGEESTGGIFTSDVMRHLCCDARIQALIRNRAGEIVSIERTMRTASPQMRRVILRRDRGCRFPGCGKRCFVQIHHIKHWVDGGKTILINLIALCPGHHRLVHKKGLMIKGDPNHEVEFVDGNGNRIRAGPDSLTDEIDSWLWDDLLGQDYGTSEEHRRKQLVLG